MGREPEEQSDVSGETASRLLERLRDKMRRLERDGNEKRNPSVQPERDGPSSNPSATNVENLCSLRRTVLNQSQGEICIYVG